ncbi:MAG: hypothetical protein HYS20_01150 [Rhodocyclales bacterium]|nr:hypothetical protein [Rhodocyclales bacterium]
MAFFLPLPEDLTTDNGAEYAAVSAYRYMNFVQIKEFSVVADGVTD